MPISRYRRLTNIFAVWIIGTAVRAGAADDPYPLSLASQVLQRDLTSKDYQDVLATMIPTDLAAEWQRVATPDNYLLFARQHGGEEKVAADEKLRLAYELRKKIAGDYLDLMRRAYEKKRIKPPFDDARTLESALASAGKQLTDARADDVPVRAVLPAPDAQRHWPAFRGATGQGIVFEKTAPREWSDSQNVAWKAKLSGRGNSSVVIWGDRLFVTAEASSRA